MALVKSFCPTFQKASVDEAFLDVTAQVRQLIVADGWDVLADAPVVPWTGPAPQAQQTFLLQDRCDTRGWKDLQLYYACLVSLQVRNEIHSKLGYTCSTGIAHNKMLAKLVSATNKPAKQTVLLEEQAMEYMKDVTLTSIRGLGGLKGQKIVELFGIEKACELWPLSLETLAAKLGEDEARWIYDICRGNCHELVSQTLLTKSIQSCKNFSRSGLRDAKQTQDWFRNMSSEL
ncbi:DNA-directed DNA polymerase eta rad30, partial [Kappamyces sp. JEL0680]